MDESGPCVPSVMPTVSQESYCESGIIGQKTGLVPARHQGGSASERDATSPFERQQQRTGEVGTERSVDLERCRYLHHTAIPGFASDGICQHSDAVFKMRSSHSKNGDECGTDRRFATQRPA